MAANVPAAADELVVRESVSRLETFVTVGRPSELLQATLNAAVPARPVVTSPRWPGVSLTAAVATVSDDQEAAWVRSCVVPSLRVPMTRAAV